MPAIWIDIVNAPHARFFKPVIKEVKKLGFDVLVTARVYGYLEGVLRLLDVKFKIAGFHHVSLKEKLISSIKRMEALFRMVKDKGVGAVVSKASPEAVRVGFGLSLPVVTVYDNEHNEPQCRLTFPLSSSLIVPEVFPGDKLNLYGGALARTVKFKGVCEVAHLKGFKPNIKVLKEVGVKKGERFIVFRSPPYTSSYLLSYKSDNLAGILSMLKKARVKVLLFPRSSLEEKIARRVFKDEVVVVGKAVDTLSLYFFSSLVISGGGTMCREAALLGVPSISFFPGEPPAVNRLLEKKGLLVHAKSPIEVKEWVSFFLSLSRGELAERRAKASEFISKCEDPSSVVVKEVCKYAEKYE